MHLSLYLSALILKVNNLFQPFQSSEHPQLKSCNRRANTLNVFARLYTDVIGKFC